MTLTTKQRIVSFLLAVILALPFHLLIGKPEVAKAQHPDCWIPKSMHHTPSQWTQKALQMIQNGYYGPGVRVWVGKEKRNGTWVDVATMAFWVEECQKHLFVKYVKGKFKTNYFPGKPHAPAEKTWRYIQGTLQELREVVRLSGHALVLFAQNINGSIYLFVIPPDCPAGVNTFTAPMYCIGDGSVSG